VVINAGKLSLLYYLYTISLHFSRILQYGTYEKEKTATPKQRTINLLFSPPRVFG